jgi:putative FmdB family regulatory protein
MFNMPVYEYECISCQHRFEVKQGYKDEPKAACPQCKKKARRVFHPAPIIFKGSGFYVTENRPSGERHEETKTKNTKPPEKSKSESTTAKSD